MDYFNSKNITGTTVKGIRSKVDNVSIRALETKAVEIAMINPLEAMKVIGNPTIEAYAKEISEKLNRALENI